jgi:hypothetical protein
MAAFKRELESVRENSNWNIFRDFEFPPLLKLSSFCSLTFSWSFFLLEFFGAVRGRCLAGDATSFCLVSYSGFTSPSRRTNGSMRVWILSCRRHNIDFNFWFQSESKWAKRDKHEGFVAKSNSNSEKVTQNPTLTHFVTLNPNIEVKVTSGRRDSVLTVQHFSFPSRRVWILMLSSSFAFNFQSPPSFPTNKTNN